MPKINDMDADDMNPARSRIVSPRPRMMPGGPARMPGALKPPAPPRAPAATRVHHAAARAPKKMPGVGLSDVGGARVRPKATRMHAPKVGKPAAKPFGSY